MKGQQEDIEIKGGKKLKGTIETNTSKNGALGLIAVALLNHGTTKLHHIPKNEEVLRFLEVVASLGVNISWEDKTLVVKRPSTLNLKKLDVSTFVRIRVGLYLLPILLHEKDKFTLPNPGGCKMGERTISAHRYALENFGVSIISKESVYDVKKTLKSNSKKAREVVLYESSDTGAINTLLMAALTPGITTICFAPPNYQVQDVCFALQKLGVKISGTGTTTLVVEGLSEINQDVELFNSEDPIESMLFISIAATTGSALKITRCPIDFLKLELLKLEKMGLKYSKSKEYFSYNQQTKLVDLLIKPSKFTAPSDKIHCQPYPGINVDNLPFFVPIATQAKGLTLVHDWMWENRAIYFTELGRLGATVKLADPHRVFIEGPTKLKGNQVVCPPALRPATIILVAMLAAEGTSILRNIYSIKRGYENLVERLNSIGADIKFI